MYEQCMWPTEKKHVHFIISNLYLNPKHVLTMLVSILQIMFIALYLDLISLLDFS